MDDTQNNDKNQSAESSSKTIFQSVPIEDSSTNLKPEEVSPDVVSPEEAINSLSDVPAETHPVYAVSDDGKTKYFVIGGILIFFIVVTTIIFRFLAGGRSNFFSTPNTTPKETTLTYWGLWEEKEIFEPLIQEYQGKSPHVKIVYEKQSPRQYREKLLARKDNGPDIFRFHNTWLPEIRDVVSAIPEEVMSRKNFEETFLPVFKQDLLIGDKYYGIPLYIDGLVLVYNETLLKQAGINNPPSVWIDLENTGNDMRTVVAKLTVKDASDNLVTAGLAAGTTNNVEHFSELFGIILLLNGGDLKKLDSQEAAEALQLYRTFAEENLWNDSMPNSINAFIEGKVAMIIVPSWWVPHIKKQNPELPVKVAPVPKGLNGKSLSLANYWVEGVSKYRPNQLEAWKFLAFLASKESQTKIFKLQSQYRLFGTAYSRIDLINTLTNHEYLGAVVSQANNYISLPLTSRTFDNGLNDEIIQYIQNAINATSEGVDYSQALLQAKKGVDQVLERYKIE